MLIVTFFQIILYFVFSGQREIIPSSNSCFSIVVDLLLSYSLISCSPTPSELVEETSKQEERMERKILFC
jgi:hypothetical protein